MSGTASVEHKTGRKPYQKPELKKGPMLNKITAIAPGTGKVPSCWVAQAAFGRHDVRWIAFREWLLADAPCWFRQLYVRHGEEFGAWLAYRTYARAAVRMLMMPAVRRSIRG